MNTFRSRYGRRLRSLGAMLTVMVVMSLVLVTRGGSPVSAAGSARATPYGGGGPCQSYSGWCYNYARVDSSDKLAPW